MATDHIETLNIIDRLRLFLRLMRDARVAAWAKLLVPVMTVAYFFWPIDVIPDFFIGIGQIDDLGVIGLSLVIATRLLPKLAPDAVVAEHLSDMAGAPRAGGSASAGSSQPPSGSRPRATAQNEPQGDVIDASYRVHDAKGL